MAGDGDGGFDLELSGPSLDGMAKRAYHIHETMMEWLKATYPHDNPIFIAVACTYEIGRILNVVGKDLDAADRVALAESIMGVMRDQIQSGLTR